MFVQPERINAVPPVYTPEARLAPITGTVIASCGVVVGMWLERFLIIVPTLANPRLPFVRGGYTPRWVEVTITIGTFAYFGLLYVFFTKLFPIISMLELKEGSHARSHEVTGAVSVADLPASGRVET